MYAALLGSAGSRGTLRLRPWPAIEQARYGLARSAAEQCIGFALCFSLKPTFTGISLVWWRQQIVFHDLVYVASRWEPLSRSSASACWGSREKKKCAEVVTSTDCQTCPEVPLDFACEQLSCHECQRQLPITFFTHLDPGEPAVCDFCSHSSQKAAVLIKGS